MPIYNHIFMSIPVPTSALDKIEKEILSFLWTKQQEGVTIKKGSLEPKKEFFSLRSRRTTGEPPQNDIGRTKTKFIAEGIQKNQQQ